MAFGIFIHRADSIYDDRPDERYQFPPQYLGRIEACIGDWVIYYEPRKVPETRGYFAAAKVQQVIADPGAPGMHIALIEPGSYLDFARPVAFADPDGYIERGLLNPAGRLSGRAQSAVRPLSPDDFRRILARGLGDDTVPPRVNAPTGFAQEQAPLVFEQVRDRATMLTSRILRDAVFRGRVLRAYGERCAVTGLRLINGGGRAEMAAAHIRPVQAGGPDSLANGIALSGTAHWMFDRGLIGIDDDLAILVSRQANDPDAVRGVLNPTGRAIVPSREVERPHPRFLQWHRANCFKH